MLTMADLLPPWRNWICSTRMANPSAMTAGPLPMWTAKNAPAKMVRQKMPLTDKRRISGTPNGVPRSRVTRINWCSTSENHNPFPASVMCRARAKAADISRIIVFTSATIWSKRNQAAALSFTADACSPLMTQLPSLLAACLLLAALSGAAMTVVSLGCEHRENPLGVDVTQPNLSWVLESSRRGDGQSAYQVLVASSRAGLDK